MSLNTLGVDVYCTAILNQVAEAKQKVEDNQMLIVAIDDIGLFHTLQEQMHKETQDTLITAINDAFQDIKDAETITVCDRALQQVILI